ncbi:MAG TPA: serine hydrolase, partial [Flavitalea sp.]|nr:serine hydrolase [Flavitalea sp.]
NGLPSIGQFIRKAFLISDNDAYNRMYQFVSQRTINRRLHHMGYRHTRITRQFMGFDDAGNRHTNPVRFLAPDGILLSIQPPAYNTDSFRFPAPVFIGKGYINSSGQLVNEPFNFTRHNFIPLQDLQLMLQSIIFPASVKKKSRFKIDAGDQRFLLKYLSQYPSETSYPKYDDSIFYDSYVKFFFLDSTHQMPHGVRVFNKVGWAYGFLTDVSYVLDTVHNVEYMLAATIYANSDGILNDDNYDFDSIGRPFLTGIGQAVYQYELNRPRKHGSRIPGFGIEYDHRDPNDKRPAIRVADN